MKRSMDIALSLGAAICLLPLMGFLAALIRRDGGPAFFRQMRVGQFGKPFRLFKFRTMVPDAESLGAQVTAGRDPRITRIGAFLRETKLDELPQLFNILRGEMSIVGPRPEVPRYVARWGEENRRIVLALKPGLTDYAAIRYRNEAGLLADAPDPERTYIQELLPKKLALYRRYARERSLGLDLRLIAATVAAISGADPGRYLPEFGRSFEPR